MKPVFIVVVVLSFVSLAGCSGRAPDSMIPKRFPQVEQDCIHVPFPQCSGG
jgi:hypothetical protein